MVKIFEHANDQHVRNIIVYGKTADSKLYTTSDYETQVTQEFVEDVFNKGMLIVNDGTNLLVPVAIAANKITTVKVASNSVTGTEWIALATPEA